MSSLSRFIRTIFITSPAKLGRMLLIVILTMQSMVTMADDCSSAHDDCGSDASYIVEQINSADKQPQCDDLETASHVEDDCAECSNNCCSCCMTLMQPITALKSVTASPDSHIFVFNFTSVESPYFAFLRPPKALIV